MRLSGSSRALCLAPLLGGVWLAGCFFFQNDPSGTGGAGGTAGASPATSTSTSTSSSSSSSSGGGGGAGGGDGGPPPNCAGGPVGFSRPATIRTFASYNCMTPAPLVVLLHDYGSTGAGAEAYFNLAAQADAMGFLYVVPDGTKDSTGNQFWNATDACCNIDGSKVDDSGYLSALIGDVQAQYNVDPKRIYLFGYGNGGFMAYRAACDHANQITAVASLGGATWASTTSCKPLTAVSVIEIHGDADATFAYGGGTNQGAAYPSAQATATTWSTIDRCKAGPTTGTPVDLDSSLSGAETTVSHYSMCFAGSGVDLWSIQGGAHTLTLSTTFASTVLGALLAHTKP